MVLGGKVSPPTGQSAAEPSPAASSAASSAASPAGEDVWAVHDGRASGGLHPQGYLPAGDNPTITNVTLASLGIRSPSKAWGLLVVLAVTLIAVGAAATWFWLKGDSGAAGAGDATDSGATANSENGEGDIEIGTPLPSGLDAPDRDFVAGTPRVARSRSSSMRSVSSTRSSRTGTTRPSTGTSAGSTMRSSPASMADRDSSSGSTAMTDSSTTMATPNPEAEVPAERDIETDLYTGRVRYVISRYYASRAQGCFDRATRNQRTVRGRVVVAFTIGASGAVSQSSVSRNTTGIDSLGQCLANQVRTWRLPAPPAGQPMSLEMPFSR